jgi:hypothetical protein
MKEELEARIAEVDLKCEEQIEKDNRSLSAKTNYHLNNSI